MSGIRQTAVRESVAHQEITEFIVNSGNGHGKKRKDSEPDGNYGKKQQRNNELFALRETRKEELYFLEKTCGEGRLPNGQKSKNKRQQKSNLRRRPKACTGIATERFHFARRMGWRNAP